MKKSKFALLIMTGVFLCVLLGIYIGRDTTQKVTLHPRSTESTEDSAYSDGKIDINKATVSQLMILPGIGETLAQRIIEFRQQNGPFRSTADLAMVEGIGNKKLEAIAQFITAGG